MLLRSWLTFGWLHICVGNKRRRVSQVGIKFGKAVLNLVLGCYRGGNQPWELSSPQCQHCQIARWGSSASLSLCTFQWWSGRWVSHRTPPHHMHQDYKVRENRQGHRGVILYIKSNITINVWLIKPLSRVLQGSNYCISEDPQPLSSGPLNMKNIIHVSELLAFRQVLGCCQLEPRNLNCC